MFDGLISRLPIYTRSLDVFGYELQFCSGGALRANTYDDAASFGEYLIRASHTLKLEELTGARAGLIRLPAELLTRCEEVAWPRERLVFAVPDRAINDRAVSEAMSQLARKGFRIAVDNPSRDLTRLRRDAGFVTLCSLDATATADLKVLAGAGLSVDRPPLLVRDLASADQYDFFQRLGFDYYEGEFFVHPRLVHGTEIPANRMGALQLLGRLQDPDVDIHEIEDLVTRDLTLSYKLLRLINSAYFGMPKHVESIRRAVIFFGLQRIKNWASVVLINAADFRPRELLMTALVRARACELIAQACKREPTEAYYVAGLFSLLDAIMDVPMGQILERLTLSEPLNQALVEGSGPIGEVLGSVLALERGDFLGVPILPFSQEDVPMRAYLAAIASAEEMTRQLQ